MNKALIFDVDGTLAETEEIHRRAFNHAFRQQGLDWDWSPSLYRELLRVTGGKERIRHYIEHYLDSEFSTTVSDDWIRQTHEIKTADYMQRVAKGEAVLRPGVRNVLESAEQKGFRLAIATTTTPANVDALLQAALGRAGPALFEVICAGDMVANKKPAADIYQLALELLKLPASACIAIEDSRNGLLSSHTAGIATVVTPSIFTNEQCFDEAQLISNDISRIDFEELLHSGK